MIVIYSIFRLLVVSFVIFQKSNTLALKTEEKLQESYESFTRSLNDKYPAYLDFVQPITDAVLQVRTYDSVLITLFYNNKFSIFCKGFFE